MMDNFQFWFYIIVAVIYVVSRVMKKSNEQRPRRTTERREMTQGGGQKSIAPPRERALTFEELLREITEGKSTTQQPAKPTPRPAYVDYDDNLGDEAQDLEEVDYSYQQRDNIYQVYEKAKQDAFSRKSLEEIGEESKPLEFGKFKVFEEEKRRTVLDDIVQELGSPGGARKAVILSEILKPKF